MKILVKNVEYYEWEVPEELMELMREPGYPTAQELQEAVDMYFDPDSVSVVEESDPYYEFVEVKEN